MKYVAAVIFGLLGLVEFLLRLVVVLVLTVLIFPMIVLNDESPNTANEILNVRLWRFASQCLQS